MMMVLVQDSHRLLVMMVMVKITRPLSLFCVSETNQGSFVSACVCVIAFITSFQRTTSVVISMYVWTF